MRCQERDGYHLLDWPGNCPLKLFQLLDFAPDLVLGRYLVNTSWDSGRLTLTPEQIALGWRMVGDLAHSPSIPAVTSIPHAGYDEWLVFDAPVVVPALETLVNYAGFSPLDFDWTEKLDAYWAQILQLQPRHVLGGGSRLYLITKDAELARRLQEI